MTFIFDTGSAWTWIPNIDCPDTECTRRHYRYQDSTGYRTSSVEKEVFYGIGYVKGNIVNDDIAITNSMSTAAKDVNFLSVSNAKSLDTLLSDGLLGLSPFNEKRDKTVHLLVTQLKEDHVIEKAMFALYLTKLPA